MNEQETFQPEELEVIDLWRRARIAASQGKIALAESFIQQAKAVIGDATDYIKINRKP